MKMLRVNTKLCNCSWVAWVESERERGVGAMIDRLGKCYELILRLKIDQSTRND